MKQKFFLTLIVLFSASIINTQAFAEWHATLHAKGQIMNGQYISSITIGVASKSVETKAPPKPPEYSCYIALVDIPDWSGYLTKDIKQSNQNSVNMWTFAINPHGNYGGFNDASSTVNWDPAQLGEGLFVLTQGWDGTGDVLIHDMKTVSSFDISGGNEELYFTIIQK